MGLIFKLILSLLIFLLAALAGYKIYHYFHKKIISSKGWGAIAGYAVALFMIFALLFFGGFFFLFLIYDYLISAG